MKKQDSFFDEYKTLHELKHYLPAQAPLKDFIHHNTLHAFQHLKFYDALHEASTIFGYKTTLSLNDYRKLLAEGKINEKVLEKVIIDRKGKTELPIWLDKLTKHHFGYEIDSRIGKLKQHWKSEYKLDMDALVHPMLFRITCSYLDQGISIWSFPIEHRGFLSSIIELEKLSYRSIFKSERVRNLLLNNTCTITDLLDILVGDSKLYEQYLFDTLFGHQGWSGMVAVVEDNPSTLLDHKKITLHDFIVFELLLQINALDTLKGWEPLCEKLKIIPTPLFAEFKKTELQEVITMWQDAFEWSYYDQVLSGLIHAEQKQIVKETHSFQALFCIDDRECSIRRYVEKNDVKCQTFGTPGFFGVEFYYQPKNGKFHTKLCPAPVNPKHLIREINTRGYKESDANFSKHSHSLFRGWIISQTLGFWSAFKLALNIFKPTMTPATTSSFKHMDKFSELTIENKNINQKIDGLQVGFTINEMADSVEALLKSIGLVDNFASIVYLVSHGASSVNN
ncbi:MAG: Na-translocating system protein MpsB, partial [Bacteroidetes bacterium]|nr:Na-translocating system protein MpsB [Bacteroidota bacterium]